jgi:type I restriction enzyme S subunit
MARPDAGFNQVQPIGAPEWPEYQIGELGRVEAGRQRAPNALGTPRPYLRVANVFDGHIDISDVYEMPFRDDEFARYKLQHGDILLNEGQSLELVGRCSVYRGDPPDVAFQNSLIRFRASERIDPEYAFQLFRYCQYSGVFSAVATQTTSIAHLGVSRFASIRIRIPPLLEQQKIAAILSSVDDTIEKTQAVIGQIEVVKKELLSELLKQGVPGRHAEFKETEIGVLPTKWSVLTYGELAAPVEAAIQSGPFGSALKHSEFAESGYLVVGIDNVLDGRFAIGENHRISKAKFTELRRFQARPLDLLITVMATVGRCCVVPVDIEPAIITKHVYRLTVDRARANPYFLMYCLYGLSRLAQEVRGSAQGLSRPGLNKSLLLPLKFPIPPLDEQEEIVRVIQGIEDRLQTECRTLESMQVLKAGLLDVLLSGKVRVDKSGLEAA